MRNFQKKQNPADQKGHYNGRHKCQKDPSVILDRCQITHGIPGKDQFPEKPQTQKTIQQSRSGKNKKNPIKDSSDDQHESGRAPKRRQYRFIIFFIQLICYKPRYHHGKKAGDCQRGQKRIGDHTHQKLSAVFGSSGQTAEKQNAKKQHDSKQHRSGTDDSRISVSPYGSKQATPVKKLL